MSKNTTPRTYNAATLEMVRACIVASRNSKDTRWQRVRRFSDERLGAIVGNRSDVGAALKAVRAYMRRLEANA